MRHLKPLLLLLLRLDEEAERGSNIISGTSDDLLSVLVPQFVTLASGYTSLLLFLAICISPPAAIVHQSAPRQPVRSITSNRAVWRSDV